MATFALKALVNFRLDLFISIGLKFVNFNLTSGPIFPEYYTLIERPDSLIATIAHELSHVKLLGEKKLNENDEILTDFTTVFFGLGIFNANTAFQFYQQSDRWGYSNLGYLKIDEWAYALALFAFLRHEDNPEWKQYLSKTIKSDFERCLQYMIDNEEDIFKFEDEK